VSAIVFGARWGLVPMVALAALLLYAWQAMP